MPVGEEFLHRPFSVTSLALISSLRDEAEPLTDNVDAFQRSVKERKDNHVSLSYELEEGEVALFGVQTAWNLLDASQSTVSNTSDDIILTSYRVGRRVKVQRQVLQLLDSRFHIPRAHQWMADLLTDAAVKTDNTAKLLRGQLVYMVGQDLHDAMGQSLKTWKDKPGDANLKEFRGQVHASSSLYCRTAPSLTEWMQEITQENQEQLDEAHAEISQFATRDS